MSDVTPEAEALARVLWPRCGEMEASLQRLYLKRSQRAIDAGWTPPPDPHVEIARELHKEVWLELPWEPDRYRYQRRMSDAVRRLDLRRGDQ